MRSPEMAVGFRLLPLRDQAGNLGAPRRLPRRILTSRLRHTHQRRFRGRTAAGCRIHSLRHRVGGHLLRQTRGPQTCGLGQHRSIEFLVIDNRRVNGSQTDAGRVLDRTIAEQASSPRQTVGRVATGCPPYTAQVCSATVRCKNRRLHGKIVERGELDDLPVCYRSTGQ